MIRHGRSGGGNGTDKYMYGSNVTDTREHFWQTIVDRYWPWNRSTTTESLRLR